ncbi:F0F1 ATP synthase subunit gamma [Candidatus Saccharibacteria bacterium]|jgi:F-type H+-transporting ATPase subunit gamma|nr:F0F1 ATP synthase subunit gamma [Candidatus Saccharibacteria bacterium]
MRRPLEIKAEESSARSVVSLTSALETLSSMQIAKTKNKVLISNQFFEEVWNIYKQIRVDVFFNFGRSIDEKPINKELLILITAKGGLSGDIDNRLVKKVVEHYNEKENDVLVIGHHGALKLKQAHIDHTYYFDLPEHDYINVDPLMEITKKYAKSRIFYQHYISLSQQEIKDVDLSEVVSSKGRIADLSTVGDELVTEKNYIFEPSSYSVAAYLENSILRLTISQFVYDSRLAQVASRFKAMSAAKERSVENAAELHTEFNRAKRNQVDTRLKESLAGLKKIRAGGAD